MTFDKSLISEFKQGTKGRFTIWEDGYGEMFDKVY